MKGVVLFAFLAIFVTLCAASSSSSNSPHNAYLTYWKDSTCATFSGVILLGASQNFTLTGTEGSGASCDESIRCLLNPTSEGCAGIATTSVTLSVTVKGSTITETEDSVVTKYDSSECNESGIYDGCYFKYYTSSEYAKSVKSGVTNASNFIIPNIAIFLAVFAIFII